MMRKRLRKHEVYELLRRSFAGDLPDGVEADLKGRFDEFRLKLRAAGDEGKAPSVAGTILGLPVPALAWTRRRIAGVLASLALVILGATLQFAGASSPLADPLEMWQMRGRLLSAIRLAAGMEAQVEVRDAEGRYVRGIIRWNAQGRVTMDAEPGDASVRKSVETVAAQFLPATLAARLDAAWIVRRRGNGDRSWTVAVRPSDGSRELEVTVNPVTTFPIRISAAGGRLLADFKWTPGARQTSVLFR